jgi:KUP system potassium uptake protein
MQPGTKTTGSQALLLGAIGVVFGDIGTSPLYTLKEAFGQQYGLRPDVFNVLGVLSLVFWAMVLVVTIKYVGIVMRADNRGEGGILALMAVVQRAMPIAAPASYAVGILGILGCALFFGDAVITPAISVLSAIEGLEVAAPALRRWVVPVTLAVLVGLFAFQRHGTERVGRIFGPVMLLWFLVLGLLGALQILRFPAVLQALNPVHGVAFFLDHGTAGWLVLGAVVLAVTGGEALYADMGHFGRRPIRNAWLSVVMPALVVNYFGQGALLLSDPAAAQNPFYRLVPAWALYPMIVLATVATVIASQAVISGAFSLARQAIQLGYLPRLRIVHTSDETIGQVYLPAVNRILLASVMLLVVGFGSSSALASAYGVSVTGSMLIDTLLLMILASSRRLLNGWVIALVGVIYLIIDGALLSANAVKFLQGAWVPVAIGLAVFTLMRTWRRGRQLIRAHIDRDSVRIEHMVKQLRLAPPQRVPGTAVFLTPSPQFAPPALRNNLEHNHVLHERNVLLGVETVNVPFAKDEERVTWTDVGHGFARLSLRFGYMEDPDVPRALVEWNIPGTTFDLMETTFFASRESIVADAHQGMPLWRDKLFLVMMKNATPATEYFSVPGNRLVELGTQVAI